MEESHRYTPGAVCLLIAICVVAVFIAPSQARGGDFSPSAVEFFEKEIRPLLAAKCVKCHGGEKVEGELRLQSRGAILKGGSRGPAAVAASPETSLLVKALHYKDDDLKMPPDGKLAAPQIELLEQWVKLNLPWPDEPETASATATGWSDTRIAEVREKHWSFRPVNIAPIPQVKDTAWPTGEIDRFLLAKLERQGLSPAAPADKRTWLRRATFDLTGLPPTLEELTDFLADESSLAQARAIDRLLASPHYGERWGRHWLDVARYADSSGKDENHACANAFRYRDYVVRSLNEDKPYNRFIVEQLAGDLLPATTDAERFEALVATGFLQLGPKALAEQDKKKLLLDIADEQLDTVGRGILGLTVTCARCHDHKFDPIPTRDYYALAGIFHSTKTMQDLAFVSAWLERPLADQATIDRFAAHEKQIAEKKKQIEQQLQGATAKLAEERRKDPPEKLREQFSKEDLALLITLETERDALVRAQAPPIPLAMAVAEGEVADLQINIRGNHLNLGPRAPRGFLQVSALPDSPSIPTAQSGRLELARWIVRPDHPLTTRVFVNRVWQAHFGQGLCRSPDNFGLRGQLPDHPELLDWLAARFAQGGWSIKNLHREILLSSAYGMSCAYSPATFERDPENRLLWRFNCRRLSAEEIRDSLLATSGELDQAIGGNLFNYTNREPHVTYYKGPVNYDFRRRTLYLPVVRAAMVDVLELFDHGAALTTQAQRDQTTVAPQALYLMNSPVVSQAAERLAVRLIADVPGDAPAIVTERTRRAYEILLGRLPRESELALARAHLEQVERLLVKTPPAERSLLVWRVFCQSLTSSNEFLYID